MDLKGVGKELTSIVKTTGNKDTQNKKGQESDLTIARALADGEIDLSEVNELNRGGNYSHEELANLMKGSINERIKKELLSAGYTEKDIEKFSKEMQQNHQENYIKKTDIKVAERNLERLCALVEQDLKPVEPQFGL